MYAIIQIMRDQVKNNVHTEMLDVASNLNEAYEMAKSHVDREYYNGKFESCREKDGNVYYIAFDSVIVLAKRGIIMENVFDGQ